MKRMRQGKLSRYVETLLLAKNILNISTFMHNNVRMLDQFFSTEDMDTSNALKISPEEQAKMQNKIGARQINADLVQEEVQEIEIPDNGYMDRVYHYLTGQQTESKTKNEETGEETTTVQDIRTRVAIFRTPEDARYKRSCQYTIIGSQLSNVVFAPVNNGEYTFYQFSKGGKVDVEMKLKDFDQYASDVNLNVEAWLFRSMSPVVELLMAYLQKYNCPGIDIDPNDVPMLLERFGLQPATVQDIEEL